MTSRQEATTITRRLLENMRDLLADLPAAPAAFGWPPDDRRERIPHGFQPHEQGSPIRRSLRNRHNDGVDDNTLQPLPRLPQPHERQPTPTKTAPTVGFCRTRSCHPQCPGSTQPLRSSSHSITHCNLAQFPSPRCHHHYHRWREFGVAIASKAALLFPSTRDANREILWLLQLCCCCARWWSGWGIVEFGGGDRGSDAAGRPKRARREVVG